ncbi:hypothetical protein RvY_09144 [Ramazzottius varieornatus]|uniref:Uncharacterized protein n=1 Tax=Ramazzottius varieornatus TaxID=947166 RepID=A0A1D1V8D1_RAMVA|nr:hypothetical protein RvY_09144 [Ramazzottius varieornatus]
MTASVYGKPINHQELDSELKHTSYAKRGAASRDLELACLEITLRRQERDKADVGGSTKPVRRNYSQGYKLDIGSQQRQAHKRKRLTGD